MPKTHQMNSNSKRISPEMDDHVPGYDVMLPGKFPGQLAIKECFLLVGKSRNSNPELRNVKTIEDGQIHYDVPKKHVCFVNDRDRLLESADEFCSQRTSQSVLASQQSVVSAGFLSPDMTTVHETPGLGLSFRKLKDLRLQFMANGKLHVYQTYTIRITQCVNEILEEMVKELNSPVSDLEEDFASSFICKKRPLRTPANSQDSDVAPAEFGHEPGPSKPKRSLYVDLKHLSGPPGPPPKKKSRASQIGCFRQYAPPTTPASSCTNHVFGQVGSQYTPCIACGKPYSPSPQ